MKDILDRVEVNLGRTINEDIREKFKSNWINTVKSARTLTQEQWDKLELPFALENEIKMVIAKDARDLDFEELGALKALAQAIRSRTTEPSQPRSLQNSCSSESDSLVQETSLGFADYIYYLLCGASTFQHHEYRPIVAGQELTDQHALKKKEE
eukprot:TRINITY_DN4772_c0_g1_i1.p1 TRINITY_DN4772_c0_g1~~TRINITY_DN4772_c0_g1_i1.p1  ORF type:complete len:163 (-),score=23.56 TRINITY_DN4772_c0_g1_i1:35-496(-)